MAYLIGSKLNDAHLIGASLYWADLSYATLIGATLRRTNLVNARLTKANLEGAIIEGCPIYGISAWGLKLNNATVQRDLIITPDNQTPIRVDDLQIAQFISLLLENNNIRKAIDTITSKAVLILGRFTPERKAVLDAIWEELRKRGYMPILFDFEKPESRDLTETISTLAHLARFIIADITDAKSIPAELEHIVPGLPSVPVMPLVLSSDEGFELFKHIRRYSWVLEPYQYGSQSKLIRSIEAQVIAPAEAKLKEIRSQK
jgi:hypothetical protein